QGVGAVPSACPRVPADPKRVYGTKGRSWGVRRVGEPELGGAPARSLPQIFFLWAPIQWGDFCTHAGIFEDADGSAWHAEGVRMPVSPSVAAIPRALPGGSSPTRSRPRRARAAPAPSS